MLVLTLSRKTRLFAFADDFFVFRKFFQYEITYKLEAAVMNFRKIQWHLITTKPCAEDILAPLAQSLSTIEIRIGKVFEQYSCLVLFQREQLCHRAPVTSMEWVDRPSFIITKEQLEVMRSYGLSWVEIAKAPGEPKFNFKIEKMFTRSHS